MATSESMELRSLGRLGIRSALVLLPFFILQLLELFVLPIDFFTFRVWEAALATPYRYPGGFYPNLHIRKAREYGSYYRSGDPSLVQIKPVEWFTDSYGLRNRPEIERQDKYDIVILGDSNIVGSFLDQKDTISEVIGSRSEKVCYSYSIAHDSISLFFSDPRLERKSTSLLIVETRVLNWDANNSYPINFREMPDGSLDVIDRTQEFSRNYYAPTRLPFLKILESRLTKQAMFHWLEASLAVDFVVPARNRSEMFVGTNRFAAIDGQAGWRPLNWMVNNVAIKPLPAESQPALTIKAMGPSPYWLTERFVSSDSAGKIIVRFEARNSVTPSRHRIWIHEDGSYRSVGELVARSDWQKFEIPITTNPGSILEFQVEQLDDWQWLSIRDVQVIGGQPLHLLRQAPVPIPMAAWTGTGEGAPPCAPTDAEVHDCRQWSVAGRKGYVHTPVLPQPGEGGLLIRFEARTDRPAPNFTQIILFEGEKYRAVAQYTFASEWREYTLLVQPERTTPIKIHVDYPDSVDSLSIRDFQAIPVDRLRASQDVKAIIAAPSQRVRNISPVTPEAPSNRFPKPHNLTPLDGSGHSLTVAESQYYFYHAAKAMQRRARERGMDFILFVMPDYNISRLMPAIRQLRTEGVKVLAYEPQGAWQSGVEWDWYWQKADSHWTEAAVRLTADEILRMWKPGDVANRPFSKELMATYSNGFPNIIPLGSEAH